MFRVLLAGGCLSLGGGELRPLVALLHDARPRFFQTLALCPVLPVLPLS